MNSSNPRILFIAWYFPSLQGGAERSAIEILKRWKEKGHEVIVESFDEGYPLGTFEIEGIRGRNHRFKWDVSMLSKFTTLWLNRKYYGNLLSEIGKPGDLVLTQGFMAPYAAQFIRKQGIGIEYYLRDEININEFHNYYKGIKRILKTTKDILDFPFRRHYMRLNADLLKNADRVVSNSRFIAEMVKNKFSVHSDVEYPKVDLKKLSKYRSSDEIREYVTFVGGNTPVKGQDIVVKIAANMPNYSFLILGPYKREKVEHNITYCPFVNDIGDALVKTRVLIVPSRWHEAFGRVVLEANYLNVPVITSARGGLVEANPNPSWIIQDLENIDLWVQKIRAVVECEKVEST